MKNSDFIPTGYHSVNPYILVNSVSDYFTFLETVFDARMIKKIENGAERYIEAKIGDTVLMIQEQSGDIKSEKSFIVDIFE
jgi:PhnB protein